MADEEAKYASIEETLFQLLQTTGARDMDQGGLLVLISLVNMMGIINIINYRAGIKQSENIGKTDLRPAAAGPPLDPASLLAAMGEKGGAGLNPQLAGLLSRFMAAPGAQQAGPDSGGEEDKIKGKAGEIKAEGKIGGG